MAKDSKREVPFSEDRLEGVAVSKMDFLFLDIDDDDNRPFVKSRFFILEKEASFFFASALKAEAIKGPPSEL